MTRSSKLLDVVPMSVIHQRLRDEAGLAISVASLRRYVRARFPERSARAELELWRPPSPPGAEAQVDYRYMGMWFDPSAGRGGGCGRCRWCCATPVPVRPPGDPDGPAGLGRVARVGV